MDRAEEAAHLERADQHIADGQRRIARQRDIIETKRLDAPHRGEAERLLILLQQSLRLMVSHRESIARELERQASN
jgi:hypothetical protein